MRVLEKFQKMMYMRACVCACVYGYVDISADTLRIHKRALDTLELRVTGTCSCLPWVLGIELSSSAREQLVHLTREPALQAGSYCKILITSFGSNLICSAVLER